ncbi:hypothetical protein BU23DRAFT_229260 [Bimuria novae-zelandiae CBS 107.79]|uniref:Uncharacterized protein n=1 Tax=Bimuria novae-zelandiae CBS 107.79 TaxID=1447943 RepID=A0A6A5VPF4_9PLEO|nr:hypothetical protein BU23DRAFT_229260 [Bimuria novae-zelandiae CBS 107.79]
MATSPSEVRYRRLRSTPERMLSSILLEDDPWIRDELYGRSSTPRSAQEIFDSSRSFSFIVFDDQNTSRSSPNSVESSLGTLSSSQGPTKRVRPAYEEEEEEEDQDHDGDARALLTLFQQSRPSKRARTSSAMNGTGSLESSASPLQTSTNGSPEIRPSKSGPVQLTSSAVAATPILGSSRPHTTPSQQSSNGLPVSDPTTSALVSIAPAGLATSVFKMTTSLQTAAARKRSAQEADLSLTRNQQKRAKTQPTTRSAVKPRKTAWW